MPRDLLLRHRSKLPAGAGQPAAGPFRDGREPQNESFAFHPELLYVRDRLVELWQSRQKAEQTASRWRTPQLRFFYPRPEEVEQARSADDSETVFEQLAGQLEQSRQLRRTAKAVPNLVELARRLALHHSGARKFAELFDLLDDEVVTIIEPRARLGWRLQARGIRQIGQFQILFDHQFGFETAMSRASNAYAVCRGTGGNQSAVGSSHFEWFQFAGLKADGSLPGGFSGSRYWLWNQWSAQRIPTIDGERVVLLAEPHVAREWEIEPTFPRLQSSLNLLEALEGSAVDDFVADRLGVRLRPVVSPKRVQLVA